MQNKRVLLMYISEVSGHHQATRAIERSLKAVSPGIVTLNINGFGYAYPILERIVNKAYMSVIKRTPKVWDYLYDNPRIFRRLQSIKRIVHKANHTKFDKLFKEFQPDCVVCSQAFPCGMAADYKKTYNLDTKIVGVLTDYAPHSYWLHEGVDYYVVPSEDTAQKLIGKGVAGEKIRPFGIPVDPKFTVKLEKAVIAEKLNLNANLPVVLIMGGGQGLGPIQDVVNSLLQAATDFQLIVVAGTNKKLIKWLKKIQLTSYKTVIFYEFTDNIDELMELAAVAVTKPGGMTTTEALTKGLPMIIVKPLPGQEMHNTDFLLRKGAAIRVNRLEMIGREVDDLFRIPERLEKMRQAALEQSKPNSAFDIARLILE